jgi:DNA polymerase/3'-5' exonuclease PolX
LDQNLALAGLLLDLAFLAGKTQRAWGYRRAAKAVLRLQQPVDPIVEANMFRSIPGIGPTTDRIARELLHDGTSAFVERAVREWATTRQTSGA